MPFYHSALGDRLEYELRFIDYSCVIVLENDGSASYSIENISLKYDMMMQPELLLLIHSHYTSRLAIFSERVLCHCKLPVTKSDTLWNINLNTPACSMQGILMLFENLAKI